VIEKRNIQNRLMKEVATLTRGAWNNFLKKSWREIPHCTKIKHLGKRKCVSAEIWGGNARKTAISQFDLRVKIILA